MECKSILLYEICFGGSYFACVLCSRGVSPVPFVQVYQLQGCVQPVLQEEPDHHVMLDARQSLGGAQTSGWQFGEDTPVPVQQKFMESIRMWRKNAIKIETFRYHAVWGGCPYTNFNTSTDVSDWRLAFHRLAHLLEVMVVGVTAPVALPQWLLSWFWGSSWALEGVRGSWRAWEPGWCFGTTSPKTKRPRWGASPTPSVCSESAWKGLPEKRSPLVNLQSLFADYNP